mgnify:CR=1 FL=1
MFYVIIYYDFDYPTSYYHLMSKDKEKITHKDLTKKQLESLKDAYLDNRVNSMREDDLRKFVKEVLELQIRGTVGNEEEKEVWKEMKDFFKDDFEKKIKIAIKENEMEELILSPEEEEFKKRLETLEQRKSEQENANKDMW